MLNNRIFSSFLLFSFLILLFMNTSSLYSMNEGEDPPENVLLITIDTLRAV